MEDDKKTTHNMITRSKQQSIEDKIDTTPKLIFEKVDSTGNLMDLIDDTAPQDFDEGLLKKELDRLRGASSSRSPKKVKSPSKKIVKGKGKKANILELILPYLIMNALNPPEAGGGNVHKFNTKKKNKEYKTQKNLSNKSFIETIFNTDKQSTIDFEIEDEDIESSEEELSEEELSEEGGSSESLSGSEEEGLEETDEESDDDEKGAKTAKSEA